MNKPNWNLQDPEDTTLLLQIGLCYGEDASTALLQTLRVILQTLGGYVCIHQHEKDDLFEILASAVLFVRKTTNLTEDDQKRLQNLFTRLEQEFGE